MWFNQFTRYFLWKQFENFIFFIHLFHSVTKWGQLTNCIINDNSALSYCRNCNSFFYITKLIICGPIFASKVFLIRIAPREERCLYYIYQKPFSEDVDPVATFLITFSLGYMYIESNNDDTRINQGLPHTCIEYSSFKCFCL